MELNKHLEEARPYIEPIHEIIELNKHLEEARQYVELELTESKTETTSIHGSQALFLLSIEPRARATLVGA